MKLNIWISGLVGMLLGVGGTLGTQAIFNQPQPSNSSEVTSSLPSSNVILDKDYSAFGEGFAYENARDQDSSAYSLFYTPYPQFLDDYNFDELARLDDGSFFLLYDVELFYAGQYIYYSRIAHISANNLTLWQYDFLPSDEMINTALLDNNVYFDMNAEDILIFDNQVLVITEFINQYPFFNVDTQENESVFIGEKFIPIGASPSLMNELFASAFSVTIGTYTITNEMLIPFSRDYYVSWQNSSVFGEDYLLQLDVEVNEDVNDIIELFGYEVDLSQFNSSIFLELSYEEDEYSWDPLGMIESNVGVYTDTDALQDMDGNFHPRNFAYSNLEFEFVIFDFLDLENDFDFFVNFSDTFLLIPLQEQIEISAYFSTLTLALNTEFVITEYQSIININNFDILFSDTKFNINDGVSNASYHGQFFVFNHVNDFIQVTFIENYNYFGQIEDNAYQLINASSTIYEYMDGEIIRETEFVGDDGLIITSLIRTENHFIIGGVTASFPNLEFDNNLLPNGLILLTTRNFDILDAHFIPTNFNTWIDGMVLEDDVLYVLIWSPSLEPNFVDENNNANYQTFLTLPLVVEASSDTTSVL